MASTKVLLTNSSTSDGDECKCGQPGCLGHERVPHPDKEGVGKVYVPGFTSMTEVDACPNEVVVFDAPLKDHVMQAVLEKITGSA